jgi:hypothetical protein
MASNDSTSGSGDCGPVPGLSEYMAAGGGARTPRRERRGDQVAALTTDPTRSRDMDMVNNAARAALALHNSGGADSDGVGLVKDAGGMLTGGGGRSSGSTSSDPSSLEAQG